MDTCDALMKYKWLRNYVWKLVDKDEDEYTKKADENLGGGYFLRIMKNAKIDLPLQSCLIMASENMEQNVHNIIIAEEGSNARIITGCTLHPDVRSGQHIGISEFFIKRNATLNFTMIHNWSEETKVRPRSAAVIEENGKFISNYIALKPVRDIQMYPSAICKGRDSMARFNTILYSHRGSLMDIGSKIELLGKNSKGEIVSRAIATDNSRIIARGMLIGNNSGVRGHLECRGILLDDSAEIRAIPELIGNRRDIDLSHEAAIGKIAEGEIIYLMSRGLSRDEATSVIVRGFLDVDILGLPKELNNEIRRLIEKTTTNL
ncbi:MAG: SufD family Fe-S cluster assembly protein [Candidatus Altiarchaeales archaeon]|nr:MAG: SufD family Fe-S cluster assembly protein [Candidatus Altiarchaeales archaeon]